MITAKSWYNTTKMFLSSLNAELNGEVQTQHLQRLCSAGKLVLTLCLFSACLKRVSVDSKLVSVSQPSGLPTSVQQGQYLVACPPFPRQSLELPRYLVESVCHSGRRCTTEGPETAGAQGHKGPLTCLDLNHMWSSTHQHNLSYVYPWWCEQRLGMCAAVQG